MKLIFLYYSEGDNPEMECDINKKSNNRFALNFHTEGLDNVFRGLIDDQVINECTVVIESTQGCGSLDFNPQYRALVVPSLRYVDDILDEDTVIFTRGGFRSWYDYLVKWSNEGRWSWLYAANTGRQRWPFWDIVMNDLIDETYTDESERLQLRYYKPINHSIFYPNPGEKPVYDIMIGASHVHDKKGQYKVVKALAEAKRIFNWTPKCVLPGSFRRGVFTNTILNIIDSEDLDITLPGMISREELANLMRRTKLFIHGGASGQNDRGPLEAMACGCHLMIASPRYHDPVLYNDHRMTFVPDYVDDPASFAIEIQSWINTIDRNPDTQAGRQYISDRFLRHFYVDRIITDFTKILSFFKAHHQRDKAALRSYWTDSPKEDFNEIKR